MSVRIFDGRGPHVFGVPLGADFPAALVAGLEDRLKGQSPEAWAQVEIYVNTQRMARRIKAIFDEGPARLLPQIRLVSEIGANGLLADLPPTVPPLRRQLELAQLIRKLVEAEPDIAPRSAIFDLADSLAALMDEMQGENVPPAALRDLDLAHLSDHWDRTRRFIGLIEPYFETDAPAAEARRRIAVDRLSARWTDTPPDHPVIVAGSTGSRGTTALFMEAVAKLPQGAILLPGFDFDQPDSVWDALSNALTAEDHPQFRFRRIMDNLGITAGDIGNWTESIPPENADRNRLVSLALRPAPVTDQWLEEGRTLAGIDAATRDITLIEAPSPRMEATAIALCLREAAEQGRKAALISPDRMLTRQVSAALDRWRIEPDDSAGLPLQLSAPGRFLRLTSTLIGQKMRGEVLLALLKHPLTSSTEGLRGNHLRWARELELYIRRDGSPFPSGAELLAWADKHKEDDGRKAWAAWLADTLDGLTDHVSADLETLVALHLDMSERLARGTTDQGTGELWEKNAGEQARRATDALREEAAFGGPMTARDYEDLFRSVLGRYEVRDARLPNENIMIWGTLEARVQGADLVILAGLNEGSWPELPKPDPWLNREMRQKTGLLLPERRIGLSAHDFQQAIAAKDVVLTRAVRDAEAETVASRWLNRLTNLLGGLPTQGGPDALAAMRDRGAKWLSWAEQLDEPAQTVPPARRPSPRPPVADRPRELSVTRVERLIRDPYEIYASKILGLSKLDPLRPEPDARVRGTVLHSVLERFINEGVPQNPDAAKSQLLTIAEEVLEDHVPWPAARRMWLARLGRVVDIFLEGEAERQAIRAESKTEKTGSIPVENGFVITAKADRLDILNDGRVAAYDYKSGSPPSEKQMDALDKQLLLEAAMIEQGAFKDLGPMEMALIAYIGLGSGGKVTKIDLEVGKVDEVWDGLKKLVRAYMQREQGYTARRVVEKKTFEGDFDHLSRYGEWDETDTPFGQEVGE